jgi:hypothetical protein
MSESLTLYTGCGESFDYWWKTRRGVVFVHRRESGVERTIEYRSVLAKEVDASYSAKVTCLFEGMAEGGIAAWGAQSEAR